MKKRDIARATDPHREREASRYEHPIPSREFILRTLAEGGVPLSDEELAQRLAIKPAERRISQTILIAPQDAGNARVGQVVVAELTVQPDGRTQPIGRVVEVLGEAADSGIEIEIALRKHELPFKFSAQAEALAAKFPPVPRPGDLACTEDLRPLELVTIDGETARDFDDAVYCEKHGGSFRLVVAIADVSHYVQGGDALK